MWPFKKKSKTITIQIKKENYNASMQGSPFRLYDIIKDAAGSYGIIMGITDKGRSPGEHTVSLDMKALKLSKWKYIRRIELKIIKKVFS